jgi:hypothetical protein
VIEIRELQVGRPDDLVELFEAVLPGFDASLSADRAEPKAFLDDRKPLGDVNYWWSLALTYFGARSRRAWRVS